MKAPSKHRIVVREMRRAMVADGGSRVDLVGVDEKGREIVISLPTQVAQGTALTLLSYAEQALKVSAPGFVRTLFGVEQAAVSENRRTGTVVFSFTLPNNQGAISFSISRGMAALFNKATTSVLESKVPPQQEPAAPAKRLN